MNAQTGSLTNKTAKPIIAGIFNMVIGSGCILCVLGLAVASAVLAPLSGDFPIHLSWILPFVALPLAVLGIISITGGIFALQRRMWGWALAGAITTAFLSNILGIVAIVLTAVSKDEFAQ